MPEPVILAQRSVGFNWTPAKISMAIDYIPVLVRDDTIFVSHPADIAVLEKRHICEYQRVWLRHTKLLNNSRKVVNVAAAAGTIEPKFFQVAIMLRQLVELRGVVFVILSGIVVMRFVAVPRGEIHSKLQAIFSCSIFYPAHDVSSSV